MQQVVEYNITNLLNISEEMMESYNIRGKVSFRCGFSGRGSVNVIRIFRLSSLLNKSISAFVKHIYKDLLLLRSSQNKRTNVLLHDNVDPSTSSTLNVPTPSTSTEHMPPPSTSRPSSSAGVASSRIYNRLSSASRPYLLIMDRDFSKQGIVFKVNNLFIGTVDLMLEKEYSVPRSTTGIQTDCVLVYQVNRTLFITPTFKRHLVKKKYLWVVPQERLADRRGLKCTVIICLEL